MEEEKDKMEELFKPKELEDTPFIKTQEEMLGKLKTMVIAEQTPSREGKYWQDKEISNFAEMRNWILKGLGAGVVCVELSNDQIDQQIINAVDYWRNEAAGLACVEDYVPFMLKAGINKYQIPKSAGIRAVTSYNSLDHQFGDINKLFSVEHQLLYDQMINGKFWGQKDSSGGRQIVGSYLTQMMYLKDLKMIFGKTIQCQYNRLSGTLMVNPTPQRDIKGVLKAWVYESPEAIFNDVYFREYVTAACGVAWGQNILKFSSVQLPGSGNVAASEILANWKEKLQACIEDLRARHKTAIFDIG